MSVLSAYMPWYIGDYLRDTAHLEAHEHGAYMLMLAHAWQHEGELPLDLERVRKIGKLSKEQWIDSKETLLQFWCQNCTGYRQNRVDSELEKARNLYNQKVAAGKASAAAREQQANDRLTSVERALNESESPSLSVSKSVPDSENGQNKADAEVPLLEKPKKKKKAPDFVLPADIDPVLWADFIEMRIKMRKPPTDRAKWLIIGELANLEQEGNPPRKVLQQSIRNGWQDVFKLRDGK